MAKKLSDYKNEEALDLLVDLIDPISRIIANRKAAELFNKGMKDDAPTNERIEFVKYIIRNNKSEILEILARIDGVPVDEYECDFFSLPAVLVDFLSNPMILSLFTSQDQTQSTSSGPATVDTTESAE